MRTFILFLTCLSLNAQVVLQNASVPYASFSGSAVTNAPAPETNCATLFYGTGSAGTNSGLLSMTDADITCVGVSFTTTNTTAICSAAVYMAVEPLYPGSYDCSFGIYTGTATAWTDTYLGTLVTNTVTLTSYHEQKFTVATGALTSGTNYWLVVKKLTPGGQVWFSGANFGATTRVRCATKDLFSPGNGIAFNTWQ